MRTPHPSCHRPYDPLRITSSRFAFVCPLRRSKRAQAWSFDYTVGLLLFLFTFLIVLGFLLRTVLVEDTFGDVVRNAESVSSMLMGTGYPSSWRADDVLAAGLLTDGELSARKVEWLAAAIATSTVGGKDLLDTKYAYAVTFADRDGLLKGFGERCCLGACTETKSVSTEAIPAALFGDTSLLGPLAGGNVTAYGQGALPTFLDGLSRYEVVMLAEPNLSAIHLPYDAQKSVALTDYVRKGGALILIGNLNLAEFGLNLTAINGSSNASALGVNDTRLNYSLGDSFENLTGYGLTPTASLDRYVSLVRLSDGRDFAARYAIGDGDVYYLGGIVGAVGNATLLASAGATLNASLFLPVADCVAIDLPVTDAKHVAVVKRLVAYRGDILVMTVTVWEAR